MQSINITLISHFENFKVIYVSYYHDMYFLSNFKICCDEPVSSRQGNMVTTWSLSHFKQYFLLFPWHGLLSYFIGIYYEFVLFMMEPSLLGFYSIFMDIWMYLFHEHDDEIMLSHASINITIHGVTCFWVEFSSEIPWLLSHFIPWHFNLIDLQHKTVSNNIFVTSLSWWSLYHVRFNCIVWIHLFKMSLFCCVFDWN